MPRRPHRRQCPRCGIWNDGKLTACTDCHASIVRSRFQMTPDRIKYLHVLALRQKGLDREDYESRLRLVGVESSKDLSANQYREFIHGLRTLPDVPRARRGG